MARTTGIKKMATADEDAMKNNTFSNIVFSFLSDCQITTIVYVVKKMLQKALGVCYYVLMLLTNRKAHFNYEFLEKLNAGIELFGFEVKSIRAKLGSLEGAYVIVRGNEAFLVNAYIPAYQPKNAPKGYDEKRNRKLLLTKKEIEMIAASEAKKGLTIVPISVYNKGRKIKVELAIARGKKKYDKRETLKKRDSEREMQREMKG